MPFPIASLPETEPFTMRPISSSFAAVSLILRATFSLVLLTGAAASESHPFLIAANDGYGLDECLAGSNECGQVVADAWCEAHGHGTAISFGLQSAFSGVATKVSTVSEPYVINCRD
jgi:hypothetical protein